MSWKFTYRLDGKVVTSYLGYSSKKESAAWNHLISAIGRDIPKEVRLAAVPNVF